MDAAADSSAVAGERGGAVPRRALYAEADARQRRSQDAGRATWREGDQASERSTYHDAQSRTTFASAWEDPDQAPAPWSDADSDSDEEFVPQPRHAAPRRSTVYSIQEERRLVASGVDPHTGPQRVKQGLLCAALVVICLYEAILKAKAVRTVQFDLAGLLLLQSLASMGISLGFVLYNGEGATLKAGFGANCLKFAPPGLLFGTAMYLSLLAMGYLAPDVFKVLEQTKLLVMGVLGTVLLKKRLSTSSWVALVSITLCCLAYGLLKAQEQAHLKVHANLLEAVQTAEQIEDTEWQAIELTLLLPEEGPVFLPVADEAVEFFDSNWDLSHGLTQQLKRISDGTLDLNESTNCSTGFLLTGLFILANCGAAMYSEAVLKREKHLPFYIQKFFIEIAGVLFALIAALVLRPLLLANHVAEKELAVSFLDVGIFRGWSSPLLPGLFACILAKSWLAGIICKQLSALAKQLCSIVSVGLLYFMVLMHDCGAGGPFMCPSGIQYASFNIVMVDFAVLCSVTSFVAAGRDKRKRQVIKDKIAQAL